jgi:hypothetical protein
MHFLTSLWMMKSHHRSASMSIISNREIQHGSKKEKHHGKGPKVNVMVCSPIAHCPLSPISLSLSFHLSLLSIRVLPTPFSPQSSAHSAPEPCNTNYTRPIGPELVCPRHPSCSGLPEDWTHIHDRFIAYLATHAPLDKNGKIPRYEERRERWTTEDIARLVMERFPSLGCYVRFLVSCTDGCWERGSLEKMRP